ncbi:MAG TPA: DUF4410 domain-containing protein [Geminicoccaceae bacterium]|nr:DUF4410 domain-containing protein [Geminicoccaceae bacterium]
MRVDRNHRTPAVPGRAARTARSHHHPRLHGEPGRGAPGIGFAAELASAGTPTAEQLEVSRKLGAEVARELVAELQGLGLPAVGATGQPAPQVDDVVLRGHLVSVQEGSASKRVLLGVGAGAAELHTAVEGYQMTPQRLRPLGRGEIQSGGGDMPGMVAPLAVVAATANPIGLVVGGVVKATGEATGSETIEGAAKRTAKETAAEIQKAAEEQGWI